MPSMVRLDLPHISAHSWNRNYENPKNTKWKAERRRCVSAVRIFSLWHHANCEDACWKIIEKCLRLSSSIFVSNSNVSNSAWWDNQSIFQIWRLPITIFSTWHFVELTKAHEFPIFRIPFGSRKCKQSLDLKNLRKEAFRSYQLPAARSLDSLRAPGSKWPNKTPIGIEQQWERKFVATYN